MATATLASIERWGGPTPTDPWEYIGSYRIRWDNGPEEPPSIEIRRLRFEGSDGTTDYARCDRPHDVEIMRDLYRRDGITWEEFPFYEDAEGDLTAGRWVGEYLGYDD